MPCDRCGYHGPIAIHIAFTQTGTSMSVERKTNWVRILFGPSLAVIGFFYRSYQSNRARLDRFMGQPQVASVFKVLVAVTFLAWIGIWMLATDESRDRLTDAVESLWSDIRSEKN